MGTILLTGALAFGPMFPQLPTYASPESLRMAPSGVKYEFQDTAASVDSPSIVRGDAPGEGLAFEIVAFASRMVESQTRLEEDVERLILESVWEIARRRG